MATNRMYLLHTPTQIGIHLGKQLNRTWYKAPEAEELEEFYDYVKYYSTSDIELNALVLVMENDQSIWFCTGEKVGNFLRFVKSVPA